MSVNDYKTEFASTMVNKDMTNMHQDYFLMLNDDGSKAMEGEKYYATNTLHKLTITSDVDQNVRVITHVWEDRGFPKKC